MFRGGAEGGAAHSTDEWGEPGAPSLCRTGRGYTRVARGAVMVGRKRDRGTGTGTDMGERDGEMGGERERVGEGGERKREGEGWGEGDHSGPACVSSPVPPWG